MPKAPHVQLPIATLDVHDLFLDGIQPNTHRSHSVVIFINEVGKSMEDLINMDAGGIELTRYAIDNAILLI
jgi:hypothetical protein